MKKYFILLILIFINFQSNLKAEIVYIDINLILKESEVGKSLNNYIKDINNKNISTYKNREQELVDKEKLLITQQNILEKSEFDKKLSMLSNEVKKYQSDRKKSNDKINQIKITNTKKILSLLNPIITKYVEDNAISLVLPKKNIIVGKKDLDITQNIIDILNRQVKSIKF